MSGDLQQVLEFYRAGNYAMVMSRLGPIVSKMKTVDPSLALIMAQSCMKLDQFSKAAEWYDRACVPSLPHRAQVQILAANVHVRVKNWDRALEITRELVRADPRNWEALSLYRVCLRTLLAFDEMEKSDEDIRRRMLANEPGIFDMEKPLDHLFWSADEALAARLTRMDGGTPFTVENRQARRSRPHAWGERIRVAYLSNDLSDRHATMRLIQGVLPLHDPKRFDVFTLCYTEEGLIAIDEGLRAKLPSLVDIKPMSDDEVVTMLRKGDIDILVDLKGHTKDPRLDIVNKGAAPIQVAWLGFPGIPTGIDCDYMLGDAVVTPEMSAPHWNTKFCRLPESYQPNDDRWRALPPPATRGEIGLPEDKVVFASFNSQVKVSPRTVRLWMEVLKGAPESVLWMRCEHKTAQDNMRKAAKKAGIDPKRIIFADFADYPKHVARLQAADLGIDTFPCNGHTTTSDKLWAGLPMATIRGTSFASRVSESLLRALGLPELVAEDDTAYVALNIRLATDRDFREGLKARIRKNRFRAPLFDTERFTRHLERAYEMMVERARAGLPPESFDVPALPVREKPFRD
jgi:predicted O-linked N-acetylglucosamine transferase (SPINDLY family)